MSSRQSSNGPETSRSPLTSPTERASRRRPAKSSAPVSEPRRSGTLPAAFEDDELIDYVDDDEDMDVRRSSFSSQSARDRRASSIPLSPPSVGSYDGHYQDDDGREMRVDNVLGHWHFAPLLIAIVPPLGAVVGGKADAWSDAILLFIASFYLYQLLKVPHDIYHAARTRRVLQIDAEEQVNAEGEPLYTPEQRRSRAEAAAELRKAELISLVALVVSPIAGAWLLTWLMDTFTDGSRYLNTFNIRLFMLASGIKPWSHAASLLRRRLLHLQEVVHYPSSRVESLNRRMARLESDLSTLRKLVAMKSDVSLLRDGIDLPLSQLSRTMRRYEKKEEHLRMSAEDKFGLVESRLEDLLREVAINAELIEEERRERQRVVSLPFSIFQALRYAIGQRSHESPHREYLYDAPRNLPSTATLNLTAPPATESASTAAAPVAPTSAGIAKSSSNMAQSMSSDSLPGYSSPPRYLTPAGRGSTKAAPSAPSPSSPASTPSWTEEGLAYWVFLPLNIPKTVLRSAMSLANSRVSDARDAGYAQGYASIASNGEPRQAKIASGSSSAKARYTSSNGQESATPRIKTPTAPFQRRG